MSSVRGKQAEIAAQEEADEAAFAEQRQATAVPTDLNKLTPYRATPRSTESGFSGTWPEKRPSFGKDKWREKFANAPRFMARWYRPTVIYGLPGTEEYLPAVLCSPWTAPYL